MLNIEENLWNMKSTLIRAKIKKKAKDYHAQYPRYFRE